ncbi:hypothetical protein CTI12_AA362220 [Artemisia annua]|uniref:Zinc finger GRF-type domain-containing protein n=1 Tax=Artemisia annua TaxID=35608 RepID=A0A2U1MN15_ARTAN|nr:hypothetical protein CTI12_AA362220 [Artemisia annua]
MVLPPKSTPKTIRKSIANLCWCGQLATCRTSWTMNNPACRFLGCPNYLDPTTNCNYFMWVDVELPNQWYQSRMYQLHVNLRDAQAELVQVQAQRARIGFFNKMMMLLVVAMFLIRFM